MLSLNESALLEEEQKHPTSDTLPTHSFTETLEIMIYSVCLCIGGPLNLVSFRKLLLDILRRSTTSTSSPSASLSMMTTATSPGSQMNLLKLNLNIADLLTMFVYTLSQIIWMITYQWYFGGFLCRLVKFFHTFGFYLNSFVVACFAIDRVCGTISLSTIKSSQAAHIRVKRMLVVAWTSAFVLSLPQAFIFRVIEPEGMDNFKQCTPLWTIITHEIDMELGALQTSGQLTAERQRVLFDRFHSVVHWERVYNIVHLLFLFYVPALIIVSSYATILCILSSFEPKQPAATAAGAVGVEQGLPSTANGDGEGTPLALEERDQGQRQKPKASSLRVKLPRRMVNKLQRPNSFGRDEQPPPPPSKRLHWASSLSNNRAVSMGSINNGHDHGGERTTSPTLNDSIKQKGELLLKRTSASSITALGPLAMRTIAKAKQKTKRQAALILLAYLTFWTPYNLLAMINAFAPKEGPLKEISVALPFLNSLIVMNPIVNPLLYGLFQFDCAGGSSGGGHLRV